MFKEEVVVDCRGHMMGRLAATVAKELLNGQHVVLVRCEETNISGSLFRNKLKFEAFLRKRSNSNPRKGSQIHYRAPSKIVWRVIRGMLPHKTPRGKNALSHLKVYEGVPPEYETKKRQVVPDALKVVCIKPFRRYCRLGDMSKRVGWKHDDLIQRLEEARRIRSAAFYEKKQEKLNAYLKAKEEAFSKLSQEDQTILSNAGRV